MSRQDHSRARPGSGLPPSDASAKLRTITRLLWGLMILAITVCLLLGLQMLPGNGKSPDDDDAGSTLAANGSAVSQVRGDEGPWGRLRYVPISISPPIELDPRATPLSTSQVEWGFPGTIPARLPALLKEIGLSQSAREQIVPLAEINPGIEGLTIRPPRDLVLGLSREDRSALYVFLAGFDANNDRMPRFLFRGDSFDDWIGDTPLAPETRSLVEPLIYQYGSFLFFSDLQSIEQSLTSAEERLLLVKALSREATFLVYLEYSPQSDPEDLVKYWGRGGRTTDVRPILGSLFAGGEGGSVDITHLLPPFARRCIYTYPIVPIEGPEQNHDCHWSALNFFAEEPDERYCDIKEVLRSVKQEYYPVHGNHCFGDLVTFVSKKGILVHTAVYIADGLLFTKNGAAAMHPWMFMKLEDMQYFYPRDKGLEIRFFRRRDP